MIKHLMELSLQELTRHQRVDGLAGDGEGEDPDVDEDRPEVVVEGRRVLEAEDEEEPEHRDGVAEEQQLGPEDPFAMKLA